MCIGRNNTALKYIYIGLSASGDIDIFHIKYTSLFARASNFFDIYILYIQLMLYLYIQYFITFPLMIMFIIVKNIFYNFFILIYQYEICLLVYL